MKTMHWLALPLLLFALPASADRGDRIDERLDRRGDRIDDRLERRHGRRHRGR
jgi:hypothetical protein